ncbi:Uncharacterised protein [Vibrio cholerae]|uniref:Uncharacterized protein n=1 Tax=Vibrio cholerae TaxID=666 RepID=A0A655UY31_VIBCL|nr:Uncharacterised protein [Vibrio cholerae]CSA14431.1 Uncharacterised protein [Vibrio cholerae]CSB30678.1 Uncharacterised protein [Vibrio cholerae]CSB58709.1 Uncharacterised protein [Vibrio cholerae]CSD05869.1 Uncharacterised protein [Vibrio cholerae]
MPIVVGTGTQYEVNDFITEIFWIADPRGFLNFLQFTVECRAVKQLARFWIAILLILNPEVGVGDVAVKNILTVLRVRL